MPNGVVPNCLVMAEDQGQQRRLGPRHPADLQGLLRFALEATRNEDAPRLSPLPPMDDERRLFLENAVNNLRVNITKDLQDGINMLSDEQIIKPLSIETDIPQEVIEQFNNLEDHVSQLDNAIGFYKLGGFIIFPVCLSCEHPIIRSLACNLLGELCQNNPFCQAKVLECGYLHILMSMINNEQEHLVILKAFYGVSSIIRHYEPCTKAFFENDGCDLLNKILRGPHTDLHIKVAFLIIAIYPENSFIGEKIVSSGVLKSLILAIPKTYQPLCDQIFKAINTLMMYEDIAIINEINNPEYNLRKYVTQYNDNEYNSNVDYSEEKTACKNILSVLSYGSESSISGSDESVSCLDR